MQSAVNTIEHKVARDAVLVSYESVVLRRWQEELLVEGGIAISCGIRIVAAVPVSPFLPTTFCVNGTMGRVWATTKKRISRTLTGTSGL